jgi:hypothetical protein
MIPDRIRGNAQMQTYLLERESSPPQAFGFMLQGLGRHSVEEGREQSYGRKHSRVNPFSMKFTFFIDRGNRESTTPSGRASAKA